MNISASKFSSGCDSGWTLYLDQSYISETDKFKRDHREKDGDDDNDYEYEEDLSMVSDASSGPPHYDEDCFYENGCSSWAHKSASKDKKKNIKMTMNKKEKSRDEEHHSCLDDTASSPVSKKKSTLSRSKALMENVVDYSQGFSTTHFQGGSALEKHFGLFQSSVTKNSASEEPGDLRGGNWK